VLDSEFVQFALDDARGAFLFETEFRKAMDIAPDLDRPRRDLGRDDVDDRGRFS